MATQSGTFSGPAATASVSYSAGAAVTFSLVGEWSRAIINVETSADGGATWSTVWSDYGVQGASLAPAPLVGLGPTLAPGSMKVYPPGSGLVRLNCIEWNSGYCAWTISA